jgi:hypothetical protein
VSKLHSANAARYGNHAPRTTTPKDPCSASAPPPPTHPSYQPRPPTGGTSQGGVALVGGFVNTLGPYHITDSYLLMYLINPLLQVIAAMKWANRAKQCLPHHTGSRSIIVHLHYMVQTCCCFFTNILK